MSIIEGTSAILKSKREASRHAPPAPQRPSGHRSYRPHSHRGRPLQHPHRRTGAGDGHVRAAAHPHGLRAAQPGPRPPTCLARQGRAGLGRPGRSAPPSSYRKRCIPKSLSTTWSNSPARSRRRRSRRWTCSPTSTACTIPTPAPSSTGMT